MRERRLYICFWEDWPIPRHCTNQEVLNLLRTYSKPMCTFYRIFWMLLKLTIILRQRSGGVDRTNNAFLCTLQLGELCQMRSVIVVMLCQQWLFLSHQNLIKLAWSKWGVTWLFCTRRARKSINEIRNTRSFTNSDTETNPPPKNLIITNNFLKVFAIAENRMPLIIKNMWVGVVIKTLCKLIVEFPISMTTYPP